MNIFIIAASWATAIYMGSPLAYFAAIAVTAVVLGMDPGVLDMESDISFDWSDDE